MAKKNLLWLLVWRGPPVLLKHGPLVSSWQIVSAPTAAAAVGLAREDGNSAPHETYALKASSAVRSLFECHGGHLTLWRERLSGAEKRKARANAAKRPLKNIARLR